MLIYSYINTSGKWKNEKLCGNTTPQGRSPAIYQHILRYIHRSPTIYQRCSDLSSNASTLTYLSANQMCQTYAINQLIELLENRKKVAVEEVKSEPLYQQECCDNECCDISTGVSQDLQMLYYKNGLKILWQKRPIALSKTK